MTTSELIRDEFLSECNYALGFLTTEYGFSGPEVDESQHGTILVSFYKKEIAIECSLDLRDEMVSLDLVRLTDGKKPSSWKVNERGEIVREGLLSLLIYRGVREFMIQDLPNSTKLSKRQASFRKGLLSDARLLRKYGQDILSGSASIFEGYPKPGDKF